MIKSNPDFSDPASDAVDKRQLPNGRDNRFVVHELLHLLQYHRPSLMVELRGLLRSQCVDVGIAAIDVGPALDNEGVEAGGGIAERAAAALDEVLISLVAPTLQKRRALDGA